MIVTKSSSKDETSDVSEDKKALSESDIKEVLKKPVSESNNDKGEVGNHSEASRASNRVSKRMRIKGD